MEAEIVARLAESPEFAALKEYFEKRKDEEVHKLGKDLFAKPEGHDRLEAEKLRAFYKGVDAVFDCPLKLRASLRRSNA